MSEIRKGEGVGVGGQIFSGILYVYVYVLHHITSPAKASMIFGWAWFWYIPKGKNVFS